METGCGSGLQPARQARSLFACNASCEHAETLSDPPRIQSLRATSTPERSALRRTAPTAKRVSPRCRPSAEQIFCQREECSGKESLRELVLFAHHNILHDPPSPSSICQLPNLLIYSTARRRSGSSRSSLCPAPRSFLFLDRANRQKPSRRSFDIRQSTASPLATSTSDTMSFRRCLAGRTTVGGSEDSRKSSGSAAPSAR